MRGGSLHDKKCVSGLCDTCLILLTALPHLQRSVFMVKLLAGPAASMRLGNQTVSVSAPVLCLAPNVGVVQIAGSVANFAALTGTEPCLEWSGVGLGVRVMPWCRTECNHFNCPIPSVAGGDLFTWEPSTSEPTKVEGLENKGIKSIAAGSYHMAAVTNDGQLYTWYDSQLARCDILFC